jgi:CHAD domain-containing protein
MISKKRLAGYFKKRWNSIYKNSYAMRMHMKSESLHNLRLDIKKLDALNELLDSTGKMHAVLYSKPLRKFFRHMGRVRSAEINLDIFHEFQYINSELERKLQDLIHREYEILFNNRKELRHELRRLKSRFERSIDEVKNRELFSYCNNLLQELSQFSAMALDTDRLHESRKKIKNLIYTRKLIPRLLLERMPINELYLDQLQESIGRWHDIAVAMQFLAEKKLMNELVYCMLEEEKSASLKCIGEQLSCFDTRSSIIPVNQLPIVHKKPVKHD